MKGVDMKLAIFGAGQAGAMMTTWLPASINVVCFIDNNVRKQNTELIGYPVLSLMEALALQPDCILLAVLNNEAIQTIAMQLGDAGFRGEIKTISEFRNLQDLRLSAMRLLAREISDEGIEGALAELGVYRGDFAREICREFPGRDIYLFDTFSGFDSRDVKIESEISDSSQYRRDFSDTSINLVLNKIPQGNRAHVAQGYFPESIDLLEEADNLNFAFVSIDPDLYEPVLQGLKYFYPRLTPGGAIVVHDYNSAQFPGVKLAVKEYARTEGITVVPLSDMHGSVVLIKNKK